ncbi:hypothetical protein ABLE91_14700 [Aquabacter sp. CN5-332]|uniref:hypothetical protein n=1 Tax=Aquabacter sp. CN5-332 TaxID=3156608 RepID=UPI0032B4047D
MQKSNTVGKLLETYIMVMLTKKLAAFGFVAALGVAAASPAFSASIGTGALQAAQTAPSGVTQVGYYGPGWGRGCWNCGGWNNGAAVGAGIAAGIIGGAAIAAATAPPPVVYAPPPAYGPPPAYYVAPPGYAAPPAYYRVPARGRCWYETDGRGYGYWGVC